MTTYDNFKKWKQMQLSMSKMLTGRIYRTADNIYYNNEYGLRVGEVSRTNMPYAVRQNMDTRKSMLRQVYSESDQTESNRINLYRCARHGINCNVASKRPTF